MFQGSEFMRGRGPTISDRASHYRVLGVSPGATSQEIRAAYRRLAKQFHPDANPDDPRAEGRFKQITAAYQVLGDSATRRHYDRAGAGGEPEPAPPADEATAGTTRKRGSRHVKVRLHLTIEEACRGGMKKVRYPRSTVCVVCGGSGVNGQDGGECRACSGGGVVKVEHTVKVTYPAGIRPDETLTIVGVGHADKARAAAGDLSVTVKYKPHPYFEIQGDDLHYHCYIGLDQYIEGGRLRVPTLKGPIDMALQPRVADGGTIRLNRRGLPGKDSGKAGDIVITVHHCLPKRLSRKERERLQEVMRMSGFRPLPDTQGLFPRED